MFDQASNVPEDVNMALARDFTKQSPKGIKIKDFAVLTLNNTFEIEKERAILWIVLVFACGCAFYLNAGFEYQFQFWLIATIIGFIIAFGEMLLWQKFHFWGFGIASFIGFLIGAFSIGVILTDFRANTIAEPNISTELQRKISGDIIAIDRNIEGVWRVKISNINIDDYMQDKVPQYIRLSLKTKPDAQIGDKISCSGLIRPPPKAVIFGAYDYSRKAWFQKIGGVGFCKDIPKFDEAPKHSWFAQIQNQINAARLNASAKISHQITGGGAGFLAAITTGDRSWISKADNDALQNAGLGHIISVSGLHVGLISGIIYFALLRIISLCGPLALWFDARKIAAILSLIAAISYTIFTGSEAPAVRAAIMAAIACFAVLLDRKAISMRSLAIAAFIILAFAPENAADAGFQMSFLATMALVGLWENFVRPNAAPTSKLYKLGFWIIGAILTSLVAGLATMPISIANFGRFSTYGLVANLLSAPINDFIIGPFALLASFLSLFGIGNWAWDIAASGLGFILDISYYFSSLESLNFDLNPLNDAACLGMVLTICWLCLWKSKIKYLSILIFAFSIAFWIYTPRNEAIIARNGNAIFAQSISNKNGANYPAQICFKTGNRFAATQLLDAAHLSLTEQNAIIETLGKARSRKCVIRRGDWEAHFINENEIFGHKNKNNILSLTFDNKTYAISDDSNQNGAFLNRNGWKLELQSPKEANRPWNTNQQY